MGLVDTGLKFAKYGSVDRGFPGRVGGIAEGSITQKQVTTLSPMVSIYIPMG
jgi:hypothetical protein